MVIDTEPNTLNYFLRYYFQDNNTRVSAEITWKLHRDFKDIFTGIGCIDGILTL